MSLLSVQVFADEIFINFEQHQTLQTTIFFSSSLLAHKRRSAELIIDFGAGSTTSQSEKNVCIILLGPLRSWFLSED